MKIHQLSIGEALASLQSNPEGLSGAEARRRLAEYGPNTIEKVSGEPIALRFLKGFTHFFAILLWIAAALSFFAEWRDPGKGMATLAWAIVGVIIINGCFSFWQEYRAEKALSALQGLLPDLVKVQRSGKATEEPVSQIVPGDIILLEEGDDVPADCILIEAFGVRVNNATITGESMPHSRVAEPCGNADFMECHNVLLAGTCVVSGEAKALAFATGPYTAFGKIAHLTQAAPEPITPLQREIGRLSRIIAIAAIIPGIFFFIIGNSVGISFWQNLIFAIGIIVALVPEGLLPEVTLALAMGSQRMARRKALTRHLPTVETLGAATVICTDKTGTLTENRMAVRKIYTEGQFRDTSGHGFSTINRRFLECALLCENVKRGSGDLLLGDPMETALVLMARRFMPDSPGYPKVNEIPFDSNRKRLSTLHRTPSGLVLFSKGAPEVILARCGRITLDGVAQTLTPELKQEISKAQEKMADEGFRVLALAYRLIPESCEETDLERDLVFSGLVGLEDPPRPEVPAAIRTCRAAGIKVMMITGDYEHTARAIALKIGLVESPSATTITGQQLQHLSDTQLQLALDAPEIIFARVAADQKMRIVSALKRKGHIVAVTGDGVNDAPALRRAEIGISMGIGGTDVAREAADMVLLDDNFATIVAAIEEGRAIYGNIRKFLTYVLTSAIPELVPFLAFVLFKIPLPLTVIQLLVIDLGTDIVPALALGAEKPHPDVMFRPPRKTTERLLNRALLSRAYLFLGVMEATAAMASFFFMAHIDGWRYGEELAANDPRYLRATTACLTAVVMMQVVNVFLCRSSWRSVFSMDPFSNRLLLVGVALEFAVILFINYTPWGNAIFGTAPIPFVTWLFVVPFAIGMLLLEEFRKLLLRSFYSRKVGSSLWERIQ